MYLRLPLDGDITVTLRIREYDKKVTCSDDWCLIDLLVKKPDVLNYELYEDETLEGHEIRRIKRLIENALAGGKAEIYEPMEPYMVFESVPEYGEDVLRLYWKIYIWSGVEYNTDSTITLCLFDDDMKILLDYLKYITGECDKRSVQELIDKGILVEDDGNAWKIKSLE